MADVEARMIVTVVDEATKSLKTIQKSVDGVGKTAAERAKDFRKFGIAATVAGGAIIGALSLMVGAAREQIAVEKQLNAVLESTGGIAGVTAEEAKRLASSLQSVTNFSDDTVLAAEGIILQFTNIGEKVFPQVTEAALDVAQRLGRDLPSTALALGKALNEPANATAALARAGIQLSDAETLLIKSLAEAGMTAQAQQVILDALAKSYGNAARAAADPWIQFKNSLNDVQKQIGLALLPTLTSLLETLKPVIETVVEWIKQHPELTKWITLLAAGIGVLLVVLGTLGILISGAITALGAFAFLIGPGGLVALAIAAIGGAIAMFIHDWEMIKRVVSTTVDFVKIKVQEMSQAVVSDFQTMISHVQSFISAVVGANRAFDSWLQRTFTGGGEEQPVPRARGGTVREGMTLVGEEGPELVSLPRGSYVHTASESKRMANQGSAITIGSIHVHNEADEDRLISKLTRMVQLQMLGAS